MSINQTMPFFFLKQPSFHESDAAIKIRSIKHLFVDSLSKYKIKYQNLKIMFMFPKNTRIHV